MRPDPLSSQEHVEFGDRLVKPSRGSQRSVSGAARPGIPRDRGPVQLSAHHGDNAHETAAPSGGSTLCAGDARGQGVVELRGALRNVGPVEAADVVVGLGDEAPSQLVVREHPDRDIPERPWIP